MGTENASIGEVVDGSLVGWRTSKSVGSFCPVCWREFFGLFLGEHKGLVEENCSSTRKVLEEVEVGEDGCIKCSMCEKKARVPEDVLRKQQEQKSESLVAV